MTQEQSLLISCLADFCHARKTQKPVAFESGINLKELFRIAEEQCVDGIVFDQCSSWLSMNSDFRKSFLAHVFLSVNRADILEDIVNRFQREGIKLIFMKGAVFRDSYPVPELRSMGDVDFIIHTEDREKADRIMMEEMGCQRLIDNHDVWTYWIGDFMFEIHNHMFYEYLANRVDYRAYFDRVWDSAHPGIVFGISADNLFVPDENLHFLYLITHTAKHIINNGSGFRAFLDMIMFARKNDDKLDWDWIKNELSELELLDFAKTCSALCQKWFEVKLPIEAAKISEDFLERITEKTFQDGIFGLENADNSEARSAKDIKRSKAPYGIAAIKYTIRQLFPTYRDMQLIPWYSWVDGKPWLLPAAWIYRWGYCLIHNLDRGKQMISEPYKQRAKVEDRKQLLHDWGL